MCMRPTARELARYGTQTLDTFGYNTRSESARGLGGRLDNARSGIAPQGRAGKEVPASQSARGLGGRLDKHEVFASQRRAGKGVPASQSDLTYYNYRHYNPTSGRRTGRDILNSGTPSSYHFLRNRLYHVDILGLIEYSSFDWLANWFDDAAGTFLAGYVDHSSESTQIINIHVTCPDAKKAKPEISYSIDKSSTAGASPSTTFNNRKTSELYLVSNKV